MSTSVTLNGATTVFASGSSGCRK